MWNRPSPRLALAALLYAALIVTLSSIPGDSMPPVEFVWDNDKLIHAAEYAVFAWLVMGALRDRIAGPAAWALAAAGCAAFGAFDELYQATVPGRFSSVYDFIADAVGAAVGASVGAAWWEPSR